MIRIITIISILGWATFVSGQELSDFEDVEAVAERGFFKEYFKGLFSDFTDIGSPFQMNAGLGLNARFYHANGIENRQQPFFWILNANVNIQIYQLNIPFTALISINRQELTLPNPNPNLPNVKERFTRNFNRIGFSPHYKWIKLHGGHRNMSFSKFTLDNLTYLGGGVELTPGNIRVAAMYGSLARAEPIDQALLEPNLPIFSRTGWGLKLGYGTEQDFLDLIVFKASDDANSLTFIDPPSVFAQDNVVVGINAQKTFLEHFQFKIDYATSAITPDVNELEVPNTQFPIPSFLMNSRATTEYKQALETSIDYAGTGFNAGLAFRRIDPKYRSLGTYFFNNDLQDLTARMGFGLLAQTLQISGSIGMQTDNLDESKAATLTRIIGSADVNYTKDNWNMGLTFSNYSSDIEYVLNRELDSLNVVVITRDVGLNIAFSKADQKENQHTITLMGNAQVVTDDVIQGENSAESNMYNANLVYALGLSNQWNFNVLLNYNQNQLANIEVNRWGIGGGVSKNFLENKLNLGLNVNYFKATVSTITALTNQTTNLRMRANYKIGDNVSMNVNYTLMHRAKNTAGTITDFTESIGNFGFRYNFSVKPEAKEVVN
ncbi:MAG: hypothetical protein AAF960_20685 [Bacteroidota bacterium]